MAYLHSGYDIRHISTVPDSTEGASKALLLPRPIQENTSNFQKDMKSQLKDVGWQGQHLSTQT